MNTTLDQRLMKLESKGPDSLQSVDLIVVAGALPTLDEQARIDAATALGHFVIIVRPLDAKHEGESE